MPAAADSPDDARRLRATVARPTRGRAITASALDVDPARSPCAQSTGRASDAPKAPKGVGLGLALTRSQTPSRIKSEGNGTIASPPSDALGERSSRTIIRVAGS